MMDFKLEGTKRLVELIKDADILFWGYDWSGLDRLGLTVDKLREINPNLILVRESAYGTTGPWAHRKGWEQIAQTCCGAAAVVSEGRDQKHIIGALPIDYGTGVLSATGAISALKQREEQGGF